MTRTGGTTGAGHGHGHDQRRQRRGRRPTTKPVHGSVLFADGDDTPRAVEVPVLPDQLGGEGDRTVILTLTEPGGCATLGSPATAELTIRDDDPAPPVVQPFGLDPTFGTGGKATTTGSAGTARRWRCSPTARS